MPLSKRLVTVLKLSLVLAAGTLATGAFSVIQASAANKVCVSTFKKGKASHPNKIRASKAAIKQWSALVQSSMGQQWSYWKYASAKSLPCTLSAVTQRWNCQAIARPCKKPSLSGSGNFQLGN